MNSQKKKKKFDDGGSSDADHKVWDSLVCCAQDLVDSGDLETAEALLSTLVGFLDVTAGFSLFPDQVT